MRGQSPHILSTAPQAVPPVPRRPPVRDRSPYPWIMHLRPATTADAEAIERIRIRGWQTAYRNVFPPEELDAMPVDWSLWEANLPSSEWGQLCVVAEVDGVIVGW